MGVRDRSSLDKLIDAYEAIEAECTPNDCLGCPAQRVDGSCVIHIIDETIWYANVPDDSIVTDD